MVRLNGSTAPRSGWPGTNGTSRSTPQGWREPVAGVRIGPVTGPVPTSTTMSGSVANSRRTAVSQAARRSSSSGAAEPATSGTSRGGCGQTAAATSGTRPP